MLSKIVNDVETEPEWQPVTGEIIERLSQDASKTNIRARGEPARMLFLMLG